MTTYDPIYGELLTSREVSDLTGFTMNQLRHFRQKPEVAPFPILRAGNTSWYRKSDIETYIQEHGTQTFEYIVPEGFNASPLVGSVEDASRRDDIAKMRGVTTRNCWSKWVQYLTEDSGIPIIEAFDRIETEQVRLYEMATGDNLKAMYPDIKDFNLMRKHDPFRFWPSHCFGVRKVLAEHWGLDVSDQEIIDAPVGDVPPTKLDSM
jgi:hypothetical protein